jgi:hypothetical protein
MKREIFELNLHNPKKGRTFEHSLQNVQGNTETQEISMQRYLTQLLADLEAIIRLAPASGAYAFRMRSFEDDDRDQLMLYSRQLRLVELFNLDPYAFPPQERLTKKQLTALLQAVENVWRAWNISWECPPTLTARRRYMVMVDYMQRPIPWHNDLGTQIDFCAHRAEGECPFGEGGKCWCKEAEATAAHDVAVWEAYHTDQEPEITDPVEDLNRWLSPETEEIFPWEIDEGKDRWMKFTAEEDMLSWLYFYRPDAHTDTNEEEESTPEDYEDFEWESPDNDPEPDFPF